ncbi:MAG: hypothetical protein GY851_24320 [bacterium]|nr:hypothetical protein [bacterium]
MVLTREAADSAIKIAFSLGLLCVLVFGASGAAQQPGGASPEIARLHGTVTENGKPVSGASLVVSLATSYRPGRPGNCKADGEGRYATEELTPGAYVVSVRISSIYRYPSMRRLQRDITVRPTEPFRADFSFLALDSALSGRLTQDGTPFPNTLVEAYVTTPSGVEHITTSTMGTTGEYYFRRFPAGEVELVVHSKQRDRHWSLQVAVPPNEAVTFDADLGRETEGSSGTVTARGHEGTEPDETPVPPLVSAAREGNLDAVRALLEEGADPKLFPQALPTAVEQEHEEIVRLLLKHGADPNCRLERNDNHPVAIATVRGNVPIVKLLLDNGANPDPLSDIRVTTSRVNPLRTAIRNDNVELTRTLLEAGADPNWTYQAGFTPLDVSDSFGDPKVSRVIEEYGGKRSLQVNWGTWWMIYPAFLLVVLMPSSLFLLGRRKHSADRWTTCVFSAYLTLSALTLSAIALLWIAGNGYPLLKLIVQNAPQHQDAPFIVSLFCATYSYAFVQFVALVVLLVRRPGRGRLVATLVVAVPTNLVVAATLLYAALLVYAAASMD